jgi:ribosomal protein S18 acetylase RimI-like enzyme
MVQKILKESQMLITPMKARSKPEQPFADSPSVCALTSMDEAEVLDFLAARPVHTVFLSGFIRDNGIESDFNRGKFWGCRNGAGHLVGVALIGHYTFVEAHSESALAAFARVAIDSHSTYMILGEQQKLESFWRHFADEQQTPRRLCRELLYELYSAPAQEPLPCLRLANADDLEIVLPVNACMVRAESGVNPLETDPAGFRRRWQRRIDQKRVWIWVEQGRLIFNADVMLDTPDCIYLEGIYVDPAERGKGYGLRGLSQLSRYLMARTKSLCLLVNEENIRARNFFEKAGYNQAACYDTIFLHRDN